MTKTLFKFFTIADYLEEEEWLAKKHREGMKLVKFSAPGFYTFEECESEDVVYRLDYKNNTETEDYKQMCRDFGWELVGSSLGWLYFRKKRADIQEKEDGELFSDDCAKAEMVTNLVKTRIFPLVIIFLCCIMPNLIRWLDDESGGVLSVIFSVVLLVLFVIYIFIIVYCGTKLKRLKRKFENK